MNPCNECIVTTMCIDYCPPFLDHVKGIIKSFDIDLDYSNDANSLLLRFIGGNMKRKFDTDDGFYLYCVGQDDALCRIYITHIYGEIIKMRLINA